ncbi:MAG: hypothetical protein VKL39_10130 [Leptolyngbyaceae bacterium]|nr:hypothetical protein [Leptolyngbyaceae bacterium]
MESTNGGGNLAPIAAPETRLAERSRFALQRYRKRIASPAERKPKPMHNVP